MSKKDVRRILIWGKTYPELSDNHRETVCTGGCFEDGSPVRIYPVPFRYLPNFMQYQHYQWIEAPVWPSESDQRPESFKIEASSIVAGDVIDPDPGWMERREVIFRDQSWHYESVEELSEAHSKRKVSLGFVPVGHVEEVYVRDRPEKDKRAHREKLRAKRQQMDMFTGKSRKNLEFQDFRVRVRWYCGQPGDIGHCNGHDTAILDWGLGELGRREGREAAKQKMEQYSDVEKYELRFYLGNLRRFPHRFTVVGMWYPKRADVKRRGAPLFG
jgi:hypothetical protein